MLAGLIRTLPDRTRLQKLLDHVRVPAIRAFLRHRLAPRHEVTLRISIAPVERLALPRPPLHHLALRALGALHPDRLLLDVLARRVIAACRELAEAPALQHQ